MVSEFLDRGYTFEMPLRRAIAYLRGMPVPGSDGFVFSEIIETDEHGTHIEVLRRDDGTPVGRASGEHADELVKGAQLIARLSSTDPRAP
jgi:hypothetical protein